MWYPRDKKELERMLSTFLKENPKKEVNGVIVPHAGYVYSGEIAGKGFSFLKNSKTKKAILLGPNHYYNVRGVFSYSRGFIETPIGKIRVIEDKNFQQLDFSEEHSIMNQIPFLQFLGFEEVLPLLVSYIALREAKMTAEKISKFEGKFVFSTDLSHFLSYEEAVIKDEQTIKAIESLDEEYLLNEDNSACGIFPLLVLFELCKIKKWKPKLVEYKNSGDVTGEKSSVVGYGAFVF